MLFVIYPKFSFDWMSCTLSGNTSQVGPSEEPHETCLRSALLGASQEWLHGCQHLHISGCGCEVVSRFA